MTGDPRASLIVLALGPERLVVRAAAAASSQADHAGEVVVVHDRHDRAALERLVRTALTRVDHWVQISAATPGAARRAGVARSQGRTFMVVDGGEVLSPGYLDAAVDVLDRSLSTAFAAAPGVHGALLGDGPSADAGPIDLVRLLGSSRTLATAALVRRSAYDAVGGFDDTLPGLVDWDLLLTLAESGALGEALPFLLSRHATDDVPLRESLRAERHLPAVRRVFLKHRGRFERHAGRLLMDRERVGKALSQCEAEAAAAGERGRAELARLIEAVRTQERRLGPLGRSTLEFNDLRRLTPVSRNWGLERGRPVDRYYIESFLRDHAADVRGAVLEVLDGGLTATYGGARVERSDVLDIDPGNSRATIIADLRAADHVPSDTYDCFILTQTLHLIDDMGAVLRQARRVVKPGGVLLVTVPAVSMVAEEYGSRGDHWRLTAAGATALFETVFDPADLEIRSRGNILATTAFLHGLACHELDEARELAVDDPAYPLIVTIRAVKPATAPAVHAPKTPPRAAILLYHRIASPEGDVYDLAVTPENFHAHVMTLRERYRLVPLSELAEAVAAGDPLDRAVALTFDDGYRDNLDRAVPILAEVGAPAAFFLTTERLLEQRTYWWDDLAHMVARLPPQFHLQVGHTTRAFSTVGVAGAETHRALYRILRKSLPAVRDDLLRQLRHHAPAVEGDSMARPMVADEIRRLAACPGVQIGAHSVHHASLADIGPDHLQREVFECRTALERLIVGPVEAFAYPFGSVSPHVVEMVCAADYRYALTCEPRGLRAREHPYRLPRLQAPNLDAASFGKWLATW
jgi:peptidoglycan/xylan/chitin deacetylase (PgdA/CDA1 family)